MMKKRLMSLLLVVGMLTMQVVPAMADEIYNQPHSPYIKTPMPISIQVDGVWLPTDTAPSMVNGRTMIPMRAAGEAIGATMEWDQASRTVTAKKEQLIVKFCLGSKTYTVNGYTYTSDVAPIMKGWRTMLPIRAFSEAFGVGVEWDDELRNVNIDTPAVDVAPPVCPNGGSVEFGQLLLKYYVPKDVNKPLNGTYMGERFLENGDWEHSVLTLSQAEDGTVRAAVIDDRWRIDLGEYGNDLELYIDDSHGFAMNEMMNGFSIKVGAHHEFLMGNHMNLLNSMTRHYQWSNNALIYTHNTDFNGRPWVDKGNFQLERVIPQW